VNKNVRLNYNSTLEGSVLTLICENDHDMSIVNTSTQIDRHILNVTCHSDRNWIPNPAYFTECCSAVTTTPGPSGITILVSFI
jgi:hypothetical protein